ncbi:unnamed protein product, partial [Arabidopsis halleri]
KNSSLEQPSSPPSTSVSFIYSSTVSAAIAEPSPPPSSLSVTSSLSATFPPTKLTQTLNRLFTIKILHCSSPLYIESFFTFGFLYIRTKREAGFVQRRFRISRRQ